MIPFAFSPPPPPLTLILGLVVGAAEMVQACVAFAKHTRKALHGEDLSTAAAAMAGACRAFASHTCQAANAVRWGILEDFNYQLGLRWCW